MLAMPFQIGIHGAQGLPRGLRQPLHLQSLRQVSQDAVLMAMARAVPGPAEPPTRLGGAAIEPGRCTLPQLLYHMVKVQDSDGIGREALLKQPPQAPGTITEPDHLWGAQDALA